MIGHRRGKKYCNHANPRRPRQVGRSKELWGQKDYRLEIKAGRLGSSDFIIPQQLSCSQIESLGKNFDLTTYPAMDLYVKSWQASRSGRRVRGTAVEAGGAKAPPPKKNLRCILFGSPLWV